MCKKRNVIYDFFRRNHYLIILVLLLMVLIKLCFAFIEKLETDDLYINLASGFLTTIIVLVFVNQLIRKHEDEQWKSVNAKSNRYIQSSINATFTSVRSAFDLRLEDMCDPKVWEQYSINPEKSSHLMELELVKISEEILASFVDNKLDVLDRRKWQILIEDFRRVSNSIIKIISLFGSRLTPEQFELLLSAHEEIGSILAVYSTFPDVIGVREEDLPKGGKTPPLELKETLTSQLSTMINQLMAILRELHETIKQ